MATRIDPSELDPQTRRQLGKALGVRVPSGQERFTADAVASHALRCLAAIAGLSRSERERVLRHAAKLNRSRSVAIETSRPGVWPGCDEVGPVPGSNW
jgi:hypothetical protein